MMACQVKQSIYAECVLFAHCHSVIGPLCSVAVERLWENGCSSTANFMEYQSWPL